MSRNVPPKEGRLFLKTHKDCFLHATSGWLSYCNFKLSEDGLAILRVTPISTERPFVATVSPTPVPYTAVPPGIPKIKYLELDPNFARDLVGISQDTKVIVEPLNSIERCVTVYLTPTNPEDYEKLVHNQEKIEYDLLDQIRVVSASSSFSFRIWLFNIVIQVKVARSEPSASWVLLTTKTKVIITESSSSASSNQSTPAGRTSSQGSDHSGESEDQSGSTKSSAQSVWDFATRGNWMQSIRGAASQSSSVCSTSDLNSPESEEDEHSMSGTSLLMSLLSHTQRLFPPLMKVPTKTPDENNQRAAPAPPQRSGSHTPEPVSAPSTVNVSSAEVGDGRVKHSRMRSWHSTFDFERNEQMQILPRYSGTPSMNAVLRVQPHSLSGIHHDKQAPEQEGFWYHERIFDVFVHPSTLPEVHEHLQQVRNCDSFLVELTPIEFPSSKKPQSKESTKPKDNRESGIETPRLGDSQTSIESLFSDALSLSTTPSDVSSRTPHSDASSTPSSGYQSSDAESNKIAESFCKSIIARLCFVTRIVYHKGVMSGECTSTEDQQSAISGPDEIEVPIQVGHIVMSDFVRRLLNTRECSAVKLKRAREEWRVPYNHKPVVIYLKPLGSQTSEQDATPALMEWVSKVCKVSSFGGILTDGLVLPLMSEKGQWSYYMVAFKTERRRERHHISYLLVTPHELNHGWMKVNTHQSQHRAPKSKPARIPLPDVQDLNTPVIMERPEDFGALDELEEEGLQYLRAVLSEPKGTGSLLICGTTGSGGSSCGKSSLAKLLCKQVSKFPHLTHVSIVDCTTMTGQAPHRVKKRLCDILEEAVWHQPSVVLLDDLDHAVPRFTDAQEEASGEGVFSARRAQVVLDLIAQVRCKGAHVAVVATVQSKQRLHRDLLQSRGNHVFEKVLEISPPTLADRKDILNAMLRSRKVPSTLTEEDTRLIALRTEGYQAGDLAILVDRAISHSEFRAVCSPGTDTAVLVAAYRSTAAPDFHVTTSGTPPSPKKPLGLEPQVSSSPKHPRKISLALSSPLTVVSSSPPKQPHKKISIALSSASTSTLVPEQQTLDSPMIGTEVCTSKLSLEDFLEALRGLMPVSLRGLSLHSAGPVDFSDIGGLKMAKETLKETLLWPSKARSSLVPKLLPSFCRIVYEKPLFIHYATKAGEEPGNEYPKLFSQCPIKQRSGVLLYGPPGTGKTLLAGAVAKEFALNFVSIKGPELLSKYIGASEEAVRDMFTRAQAAKPCILFFDEFDSLAPMRGHDRTGVTDRVVNQLLAQLDGVEALKGVYVLAATSRPDLIDPALLRPGRIDRSLFCDVPTQEERLEILESLSKKVPLDGGVDFQEMAAKSEGFTGADLKSLLYNAQLQAAHKALKDIGRQEKQNEKAAHPEPSPLTEGRKGARKALVFKITSSGAKKETHSELQEKASLLLEKAKEKEGLLMSNVGPAETNRKVTASITQEQLLRALKDVTPSVSPAEKQKYYKIYSKFEGKTRTTIADVTEQLVTPA